jgi:hypothetical protein
MSAALLCGAMLVAFAPVAGAADASPAQRAFERIKALEGSWKAESTKGWEGEISYRVIAGGSAVLELSEIDPHAGTVMATLFHLDGDRLMLTHYCAAGNQPRLVARDLAADGSSATFTFLDGTNVSSRDQGHMDSAVFRWLDDDHYSSRWTWYEGGQERWMEEILLERRR